MKLNVIIKMDDNGSWYAYVPALPGCVSVAGSREEVMESVKEAIQGFLETEESLHGDECAESEKVAVTV